MRPARFIPRPATRVLPALFLLAACSGPQSMLDPAGLEASEVATLFWGMLVAAVVIWFLVLGAAVYATRVKSAPHDERVGSWLIIGGGVVFPTVALAVLLTYSLLLMPAFRAPAGGLRIEVAGEQFWWRVRYWPEGATQPIESANEVRLPRGQRVELQLSSPDVIHSFWIPSIAGKVDMIPGRTNRLVVEPTETGLFRGQCAEFCGASHALMAFSVEVMEPEAFDAWLAREAGPAAPSAAAGRDLFQKVGCGGCHAVRGTEARGAIGPDLTHFGSRATIGAGILPNETEPLIDWIARTEAIKPGVRMPSFGMLPEADLAAIAAYLGGLR